MIDQKKILFVCTGNTCRSPMAEFLMRALAEREGVAVEVASAGVFAYDGQHMSAHAQAVLAHANIAGGDAFASKRLTEEAVRAADFVLAMTGSHKRMAMDMYPFAADKTFMLNEYAAGKQDDVADPFGGSYELYRMTAHEIEEAIQLILARWREEEDFLIGPHP